MHFNWEVCFNIPKLDNPHVDRIKETNQMLFSEDTKKLLPQFNTNT